MDCKNIILILQEKSRNINGQNCLSKIQKCDNNWQRCNSMENNTQA